MAEETVHLYVLLEAGLRDGEGGGDGAGMREGRESAKQTVELYILLGLVVSAFCSKLG